MQAVAVAQVLALPAATVKAITISVCSSTGQWYGKLLEAPSHKHDQFCYCIACYDAILTVTDTIVYDRMCEKL
jgi:hypothetical protein